MPKDEPQPSFLPEDIQGFSIGNAGMAKLF
jgi:hypothetical protein